MDAERIAYLASHWAMGIAAVIAIGWMINNWKIGRWVWLLMVLSLTACGNDRDPELPVDATLESDVTEPPSLPEEKLPRGNLSANEQRYFDMASIKYDYYEAVPPHIVRESAIRCGNGFVCCLDRRSAEPPNNSERGSEYNPWQNTIYLSHGNSECNGMMETRWLKGEMQNAVAWQAGQHWDHWYE